MNFPSNLLLLLAGLLVAHGIHVFDSNSTLNNCHICPLAGDVTITPTIGVKTLSVPVGNIDSEYTIDISMTTDRKYLFSTCDSDGGHSSCCIVFCFADPEKQWEGYALHHVEDEPGCAEGQVRFVVTPKKDGVYKLIIEGKNHTVAYPALTLAYEIVPVCGDLRKEGPEQCDNGPNDPCCVGCNITACCGDGIVNQPWEECDDGNHIPNDNCTNCKIDPYCGDGKVNQKWEECDDGNNNDGYCIHCKRDDDLDHIINDEDPCPFSDRREKVLLDYKDLSNIWIRPGCTLQDAINSCPSTPLGANYYSSECVNIHLPAARDCTNRDCTAELN